MEEPFGRNNDKSKVSLNKRCCYFLVFCVIVLPIVTGVVVWYLTDSACDPSSDGDNQPVSGTKSTESVPTTTKSPTSISESEPWKNLRLPATVVPVHYDITLYPNFYGDNGWFYGNETVELNITESTTHILIHANFLNITRTKLSYLNGQGIPIKQTFWYAENQFWVVETVTSVQISRALLKLQFDGSLTREIFGFYKSTYINSETKQERHLASSKFQPVDARRAFPCFDEPNIKAEYTVTLVHRDSYIALSNMPETISESWEHDPTLKATHFQRSVPMSTYLVCFVVCDFKNLTDTTKHGTQIRVFATPDRIEQARYSMRVMKVSMEKFQDLFKVPFPLPKNDMIAIPSFISGAMEHWGLIGFREVNMLYDETQASAANKQRVAVVVAHEIAHMWFGNIVTMDWWDDLWLNEGFASFVEYIGVDETEPDWEMMDQMVVDDVKPVMVTDAGVNSHPIVVPVSHPNQITEVFDAISYSKGASILRMLQEMMGSGVFFDGISTYLKKYEWSTATTNDLWDDLGQVPVAGYSVKEVMDTWTLQMGLPYINVTYVNSGSKTRVTASQKRFLADKNMNYDENESPFRYKWFVQLDYIDNGEYKIKWITKDDDSVSFDVNTDMSQGNALIKFNVNDTGFYRVNYPPDVWRRIADALESQGPAAIPYPADRTGLVDDAFNLARAGYISYELALEMTKYLDKEYHHLPWDSAYSGITYIKDMFITSGHFDSLRKYFAKKVRPVMDRLTWEDGDSHLDKLMRSNIIQLACEFADTYCLGNATMKFRGWIDNGEFISPNIRTYVYKYGMSSEGTESDWNFMWNKYLQETVPQEKIKLLYGLANTKHVWLLNRYLEFSKNTTMIGSQDFFTVVTYISRNPVGNPLAWNWVRANYDYIVNRFSLYNRYLGRLVPSIISKYNTQFKLQEADEFFNKYPDAGAGSRARIQARESIQNNIDWMTNNADNIKNWLQQQV
ncbi:glutamyl aminopeptidase-like [Ruditapes philippinarum]|uniref:glutamyl aminopeptidase-like n=1 Tax=Ruditapes philippinarum TaxID=129788 RepID=UPI00295B6C76|nr:glutamyl aminopeptidase-like [Ruditapes philippinarum]